MLLLPLVPDNLRQILTLGDFATMLGLYAAVINGTNVNDDDLGFSQSGAASTTRGLGLAANQVGEALLSVPTAAYACLTMKPPHCAAQKQRSAPAAAPCSFKWALEGTHPER